MSRLPKPCIVHGCPNLGYQGNRCRHHEKAYQRRRNARPERAAYADRAYRSVPSVGICWICGEPGANTRDHVIPLHLGGTNHPSNIRPAHRACNSAWRGREEQL